MTNNPAPVEQRHRMLIEAIINDYHTTRLDHDYVSHILSKPRTQAAFANFERDHCTRADALREALGECSDVLSRFAHSRSTDEKHVTARYALARARAALSDAPQAAPDEVVERVARAIASGLGDDFDHAFVNKAEWIDGRGDRGGRFRDVNEPFQADYLAAARAALAAMDTQP